MCKSQSIGAGLKYLECINSLSKNQYYQYLYFYFILNVTCISTFIRLLLSRKPKHSVMVKYAPF